MYHVSTQVTDILNPRIPSSMYLQTISLEENITPRISFSDSIEGCLMGLQIKDESLGEEFFVYSPNWDELEIVSNEELVKQSKVFDCHITKECWVLNPVRVKRVGVIKVTAIGKPIKYSPILSDDYEVRKIQELICKFPDNTKQLTTWSIEYEWISKISSI